MYIFKMGKTVKKKKKKEKNFIELLPSVQSSSWNETFC